MALPSINHRMVHVLFYETNSSGILVYLTGKRALDEYFFHVYEKTSVYKHGFVSFST